MLVPPIPRVPLLPHAGYKLMEIVLQSDAATLPTLTEHQAVELSCAAAPGAWLELRVNGSVLDPFLRPGETIWRWRWNPGAAVGLHTLLLTTADTEQTWTLRVAPRKLDQERYETLLQDLQRVAYNLAYTLAGASAEGAGLQREAPDQRSRIEEYYAMFDEQLARFAQAVRRIAARPREQLRDTLTHTPFSQARIIDDATLVEIARGTFDEAPNDVAADVQEALRPGGGLLPRSVPAARSAPTHDIYEHRLLKQLLDALARRARLIGDLAEREITRLAANEALIGAGSARLMRARQIAAGCAEAIQTLRELRALSFLADVQPLAAFRGLTPLFQRDPHYRAVYRMWQALRQHTLIAFDSPLFAIPIADLPRLYEAWCALMTAQALLALGDTVQEQRLVVARGDGDDLAVSIAITEDTPLLVVARGDTTLALRYQVRYRPTPDRQPTTGDRQRSLFEKLVSLDKQTHVPDLAIEIRRAGEPPRVLLLDAKYRLEADGRTVPSDALADAYTYLGAIGCAGARATLGAWLLFPGSGRAEVYASGVGAVPLVPGCAHELARLLADVL